MGRKRKNKQYYFSDTEEQAVLDYVNTDCEETKNEIYETFLKEPFRMMTESISKRYPIHIGNYTLEEIQHNALTHLVEQMVKYNPHKILKNGNKPKAFSYCQTIVRNYYKFHSRTSRKELLVNLSYDDYSDEVNKNDNYLYEISDDESNDKYIDLLNEMIFKIKDLIKIKKLSKEEIIVGEGIVNILENWNILFAEDIPDNKYNKYTSKKYAKNKVLLLLKEYTRMETKEIRLHIKPFTDLYFIEKSLFFE